MQKSRWQEIENLFQEALELSESDRAAFLEKKCGSDRSLRDEMESLLSYYEPKDSFIESPLHQIVGEIFAEDHSALTGQRIGNFKLLRKLAHGGMGTIYLAIRDDDQYKKQVAVKLVNRGMDTDAILQRFRTERQILANLEHPYIARLLDGGTTDDGFPYFVMEYVDGKPIHEYCDEHHLTTGERLGLFLKVCSAVQYAHQNLVVHRDIKPSNILVMSDGTPKLLDFGIAKVLNPGPDLEYERATVTLHQLMTPEYASPEQISNEPITTATDVYSLGVLLYQLLTGRRPYRLKSRSPLEIQEAICKQDPEKPSIAINRREPGNGSTGSDTAALTPELLGRRREGSAEKLRRKLAGDLDYIVLKSLRKEPPRRYSSVEKFAEDIRRYLEARPILARQGTILYRSSKFVRRHKAVVAATVLFVFTLTAGIVSTEIERAKAEKRFNQVRKLANSFMFEVEDEIDKGPTKAKELLVKKALEYLDSLAGDPGGDPSLERELASAYERVGRLQGNSYYSNLGDTKGALASYRKSLEMRLRLAAADPKNQELQNELADSYEGVGDVLYTADDLTGGLENYQRAMAVRSSMSQTGPRQTEYRHALADLYGKLGDIKGLDGYPNLGDTAGALQDYRQSLSLHEDLLKAAPGNQDLQFGLAKTLTSIGMLLRVTGDPESAIRTERRAVAMMETLTNSEPGNTVYRQQMLACYETLRYVLFDTGRFAEALHYDRKTLALLQPMSEGDPQNTYLRRSLSVTYNSLGRSLLKTGDARGALEQYRKALTISESLSAADPGSAEHWRDVAITLQRMGEAQTALHQYAQALDTYRKSLAISEKMLTADSSDAITRDDIAGGYTGIGDALSALGDNSAAIEAFQKAVPLVKGIAAKDPQNARFQLHLAQTLSDLGDAYARQASTLSGSKTLQKTGWLNARNAYQQSLAIFLIMQNHKTLSLAEAKHPNQLQHAIARADSALARKP